MKFPAEGEVWMKPNGCEVTVVYVARHGTTSRPYAVCESKPGGVTTISESDVQRGVWIPKEYTTQMDRLRSFANSIFPFPDDDRLRHILDEAQNPPPDGAADGSVPQETWNAFTRLANAIDEFNHAFRDAWVRGLSG